MPLKDIAERYRNTDTQIHRHNDTDKPRKKTQKEAGTEGVGKKKEIGTMQTQVAGLTGLCRARHSRQFLFPTSMDPESVELWQLCQLQVAVDKCSCRQL